MSDRQSEDEGRQGIERLSRYIDRLNRERAPTLGCVSAEEEELYAAVRAVKSLRAEAPASISLPDRLARLARRSRVSGGSRALRRLAAAAGVGVAALAVILALGNPGDQSALAFAEKAAEVAADPAKAGIAGLVGVWASHYLEGEFEVYYVAPDKSFTRNRLTGAVGGIDGAVKWSYDPTTGTGSWEESPYPGSLPFTSPIPGGGTLQEIMRVLRRDPSFRRSLSLAGTGELLGREATILSVRIADGQGEQALRFWVDEATYLVLQTEQVASNGEITWEAGYRELELEPPSDLSIFTPVIPEGASVERSRWGPLAELAAEVGLSVTDRHPSGLPASWKLGPARLTLIPDDLALDRWKYEPGTGRGSHGWWTLYWSYSPPTGEGEDEAELTVYVRNVPPGTVPPGYYGSGQVWLAGGVEAYYDSPDDGAWLAFPGLHWIDNGLCYGLGDTYGRLTKGRLMEIAAGLTESGQ